MWCPRCPFWEAPYFSTCFSSIHLLCGSGAGQGKIIILYQSWHFAVLSSHPADSFVKVLLFPHLLPLLVSALGFFFFSPKLKHFGLFFFCLDSHSFDSTTNKKNKNYLITLVWYFQSQSKLGHRVENQESSRTENWMHQFAGIVFFWHYQCLLSMPGCFSGIGQWVFLSTKLK